MLTDFLGVKPPKLYQFSDQVPWLVINQICQAQNWWLKIIKTNGGTLLFSRPWSVILYFFV